MFRYVLLTGRDAFGAPVLLFSLPVALPLGVLRDYGLQVHLFIGGYLEPPDDLFVGKPVAGATLLALPFERFSIGCSMRFGEDGAYTAPGLGLAPVRDLPAEREHFLLQSLGRHQVAQRYARNEHPLVTPSGR